MHFSLREVCRLFLKNSASISYKNQSFKKIFFLIITFDEFFLQGNVTFKQIEGKYFGMFWNIVCKESKVPLVFSKGTDRKLLVLKSFSCQFLDIIFLFWDLNQTNCFWKKNPEEDELCSLDNIRCRP